MTTRPDHDLTPQEAVMADWLRDTDRVRGPSAELDAAILNMAAQAVEPKPVVSAKPRRNWAAPLGLVATVSLASFVLWRYQVVETFDHQQSVSDVPAASISEPASSPPTNAPAQPSPTMPPAPASIAQAPVTTPARAPAPSAPNATATRRPALVHEPAPAPVAASAAPPAPPIVFDTPPPMAAPAPPPPPAGAMVAAERVDASQADAALRARENAIRQDTARSAKATTARPNVGVSTVRVMTDVSGDSAGGPAQWLQRIEQRLARGDVSGTRESLRLYLERYPSAEIPPALEPYRPKQP